MQGCCFTRWNTGCLAAVLGSWIAMGTGSATIAAEAAGPAWTPGSLASATNLPVGEMLTVTGTVARIEKDGLSSSSFFVVLEGELGCRMLWTDVDLTRRNLRLTTEVGGRVVARWNKRVMFMPGDKVVMRGICKKERSRVLLDQASQTEQLKPSTPGMPWGR